MPLVDLNTIHNPSTGGIPPASWGDGARDNFEFLGRNRPHALVYNSANISIPNNTATVITYNSERYDVGGNHSTSVNTGYFVIPTGEAAKYRFGSCTQYASNSAGNREAYVFLNAATIIGRTDYPNNAGFAETVVVNASTPGAVALVAADVVNIIALQNSGGALNVEAAGQYSPYFSMDWVAA